MMQKEHVLVTGGAGYVGSTLVPRLLQAGYRVTVLDSLVYGGDGLLACFQEKDFTFIKGDVRDKELIEKAIVGVDVVIHLAGIVGYPACKRDPELAKQVNEDATKHLCDILSKDKLLIFASTGSNYGHVASGVCTEETPLNPLTVYGVTKTNAEKHILSTRKNAIVYRFATAFGISPRMRLDLLINDFTYRVMRENYLLIYEKDFKRTFIDVRDMANAFLFALKHREKMIGQTYNVGSNGMNYSKEDVAQLLKKYRPNYFLHFADAGKDEDQRNYEVKYDKINALGFQTEIDITRGLDDLTQVMSILNFQNPYSNV